MMMMKIPGPVPDANNWANFNLMIEHLGYWKSLQKTYVVVNL